jgi:hypothetical protein
MLYKNHLEKFMKQYKEMDLGIGYFIAGYVA